MYIWISFSSLGFRTKMTPRLGLECGLSSGTYSCHALLDQRALQIKKQLWFVSYLHSPLPFIAMTNHAVQRGLGQRDPFPVAVQPSSQSYQRVLRAKRADAMAWSPRRAPVERKGLLATVRGD